MALTQGETEMFVLHNWICFHQVHRIRIFNFCSCHATLEKNLVLFKAVSFLNNNLI
jgi:hypothetical protein